MKAVIEQIEDIVIFYNGITKDFQDIERLQSGVRKLATLLFMFAGELGLLWRKARTRQANTPSGVLLSSPWSLSR